MDKAGGVGEHDSDSEQEFSAKSSPRTLRDAVDCSGSLRFEAFTLFLGRSFAVDWSLACSFSFRTSWRSAEMTLSLSLDRDAVGGYFKPGRAFPPSDLCEPSSLGCCHQSFPLNILSSGSVCCDEAEAEASPTAAPLGSLCDASVRHDGSYVISVCHEGLYDVSKGIS